VTGRGDNKGGEIAIEIKTNIHEHGERKVKV
jgi:hypothetical protein